MAAAPGTSIRSSKEKQTLQIVRLAFDFLSRAGHYVRILPGGANEAPVIFKAHGGYWLFALGTTEWAPSPARLFIADCITGAWQPSGNPVRRTPEQVTTTVMEGVPVLLWHNRWRLRDA